MSTKSIVVSMYNRSDSVLETIDKIFFPSLLRNGSADTQVIILDDCSPLRSATTTLVENYQDALRSQFGDVVFERNLQNMGFAKSYNRGIAMADGEMILIANDDLFFPEGTVAKLFETLKEPGLLAVGPITNANSACTYQYCKQAPTLCSYADTELQKLEAYAKYIAYKLCGQRKMTDDICGFCFAADTKMLKVIGGFDNAYEYGYWEDVDLIHRIIEEYGDNSVAINLEIFVGHGGVHGPSGTMNQQFGKAIHALARNASLFSQSWGWGTVLKRIVFGAISQTGKGTVSELLR